jgi:hypothetical protein
MSMQRADEWKRAYFIRITWQDGRTTDHGHSSSPTVTREYGKHNVSRNHRVIKRIEMWDTTGPLQAFWDASWT